jgi:hypothetical protein
MLAAVEGQSMEQLLSRPTVVELESLADEEECAFVMGVLLIKIVEHLRASGNSSECRLVVVIEEAHRLLSDVPAANPEVSGNARHKAVAMFSNLLAEVRAYGAGLVICDQSPSKLARDVLKNTNIKMAHRIISADDAKALAGAMRLRDDQAGALASMPPGRAAVFSGGDDYPVLIQVPSAKRDGSWPSTAEVRGRYPGSASTTFDPNQAWADRLLAIPEWAQMVERLLNVAIVAPDAAATVWSKLLDTALRHVPTLPAPASIIKLAAKTALARGLRERGRVCVWAYEDVQVLVGQLDALLTGLANGGDASKSAFRERAEALQTLARGPLLSCANSCASRSGVRCAFRSSAQRLGDSRVWVENWRHAAKARSEDGGKALALLIHQAGEQMLGMDTSGIDGVWFQRAGFCFAQHRIADELAGGATTAILDYNDFIWGLLQAKKAGGSAIELTAARTKEDTT